MIENLIKQKIKPNAPGAAVGVVKNGKVLHVAGYGLANVEWQIPNTADTVFRLASLTKQFTAVAIMMLVEEGKLAVDDSLTTFFPNYPTSGHHITVHHLLTHTSGIFSYTNDPEFLTKMRRDVTPQHLYDDFSQRPFDFAPGMKYGYNNSGYILLGMIIEKLSGMRYEEFIQTRIFDLLDMKQSYYLHNETIVPKRASGYHLNEKEALQNAMFLSMTQPHAAGALGSTVNDLVLWNKALDDHRLVAAETLVKMHTPITLNDGNTSNYGYGWAIDDYEGYTIISHGGGINGFSTFMARVKDQAIAVIVLANQNEFPSQLVTVAIIRELLGLPVMEYARISLDESILERCVGEFELGKWGKVAVTHENSKLKAFGAVFAPIHETAFYDEIHGTLLEFSEDYQIITIKPPLGSDSGKRSETV